MLTVSQLKDISKIDSYHYAMNNKQITNLFPDLPIFSDIPSKPDHNKIKNNKERISRTIKNYCSKKH